MKKKILVAQNDRKTQDRLTILLSNVHELFTADNGLDAWEIFNTRDIHLDLIITDLILPRLSGLELLRRIREKKEWFPVIIVTRDDSFERLQQAARLTFSFYFNIPLDPSAFLKKISRVMNGLGFFCPRLKSSGKTLENPDVSTMRPITQSAMREILTKFDKKISLHDIASPLRISDKHLCRVFKEDCGVTLHNYLTEVRINSAIRLLKETEYSVEEIAGLTGFYDHSHFIKTCKRSAGMTPQEFRRQEENRNEGDFFFPAKGEFFTQKR
jgi:YesN/AraC family two-component response regulator